MSRNTIILAFTFLILIVVQVLILEHFVVFGMGFCFLYVLFLLLLPQEISFISAMLIGLVSGFLVDVFYSTLGIHAAACVLIMFIRPYWMSINKPRSGYEISDLPTVANYGLGWFISYSVPLVFVHALAVFLLESGGGNLIGLSIAKTALTTIFSLVFMLAIQYLFYAKEKR